MSLSNILDDYVKNTPCVSCGEIAPRTKKCISCKEEYPYKRSLRHLIYYNRIAENELMAALKYVDVICYSCLVKKNGVFSPKTDAKQYARAKKNNRRILVEWFKEQRANGECHICGKKASESGWKEFHYHHIDPNTKVCEVSLMVQQGNSRVLIEQEMKKCILLCRKCQQKQHRRVFDSTG